MKTIQDSITTVIPVLLLPDRVAPLNDTLACIPHDNIILVVDSGDKALLDGVDLSKVRRLIYREENRGQWESRREGLAFVDTDYVHFLDADDQLAADAYHAPYGRDAYQLFPRLFSNRIIINPISLINYTAFSCLVLKTEMAREVMDALSIGRYNYNECFYFMMQALKMGYHDFVSHNSIVHRQYISGEMSKAGPPMPEPLRSEVAALADVSIDELHDYYVRSYFKTRKSYVWGRYE